DGEPPLRAGLPVPDAQFPLLADEAGPREPLPVGREIAELVTARPGRDRALRTGPEVPGPDPGCAVAPRRVEDLVRVGRPHDVALRGRRARHARRRDVAVHTRRPDVAARYERPLLAI